MSDRGPSTINELMAELDATAASTAALPPGRPLFPDVSEPRDREPGDLCVGLLLASHGIAGQWHPFWAPVVRALRERLLASDCEVLASGLYKSTDPSDPLHVLFSERALARGVDGFVVASLAPSHREVVSLLDSGIPGLFIDDDSAAGTGWVMTDNRAAMRDVVRHLVGEGRTRIAHVAGYLGSIPATQRLQGFRDGLTAAGVRVPPEYVQGGEWMHRSGYEAAQRLLALAEPPDAIAAASDLQAVGVLAALADAGLRVPDDIAVTGFDDSALALRATPALTSVRQDTTLIGTVAAEGILQMLERPGDPPHTALLPAALVVRDSSVAG